MTGTAPASRPIQPRTRGPVEILLEVSFGLLALTLFSIFVGVLIEVIGQHTLWKDEGVEHGRRLVLQDLRYIEQAPRSILVQDTVGFAVTLAQKVRWPWERFGILSWYRKAHAPELSQGTQEATSGSRQIKKGVARATGKTSRLLSRIAVTAMFVAQDVALRLAIAVFALPAFVLACLVGIVDGLVQRDLRKWRGGRESSFVYHHAKRYTRWSLTGGFAIYLTWPFGGINPTWMVLVFSVLVAFTLSVTVSAFKKYV